MLTISAKDFGPIIEGSVNLKSLTVFVGRSNTGKSYFATLVYGLMQACGTFPFDSSRGRMVYEYTKPSLPGTRSILHGTAGLGISESELGVIKDWVGSLDPATEPLQTSLHSLPKAVRDLLTRIIDNSMMSLDQLVTRELERYCGDIATICTRRGEDSRLSIRLQQDQPMFDVTLQRIQSLLQTNSLVHEQLHERVFTLPAQSIAVLQHRVEARLRPQEILDADHLSLLETIVEDAFGAVFPHFPGSCYYLPSARSGIAQSHKLMASAIVQRSTFGAPRSFDAPTLPAITADFMGHMLTLERQIGGRRSGAGIDDVVEYLERELLHGRIELDHGEGMTYPDVSYAPFDGQPAMASFPLQTTSSMVSELAPVALFLRHLVKPGDLFILEEPESHLHPASQRHMARGIARLVNAGVKVIITTHSDYFVGQLNNCIKVSRASKAKRRKEGFDAEECLKPEDVGAYHFKFDEELGGSVVKELEIYPGYGIDVEDFGEVSLDLYEETVSLQNIRSK